MDNLRESGRFGIETFALAKQEDAFHFHQVDWRVVYADHHETSHCVWMVPGTFEARLVTGGY